MKKVFLVMNNLDIDQFKPFNERFQLFVNPKKALQRAETLGYQSLLPLDTQTGMMNISKDGEGSISIIGLEIQE